MNRTRLTRLAGPALAALALLSLVACGGTAAASGAAAKTSPSPGARARNGTAGELVQMNGMTLILSATSGDLTVVYDTSTTFQKTSTGTFADVSAGKCIVATGQKDAAGTMTAATVRLTGKVNGTCAVAAGPGGGGGGGNRTPPPGASPRPNRPNVAFVAGEVTAVKGTAITIQPATGAAQLVTIPTTATVSRSAAATAADLALHQCVQANGPRDAAGKVTARTVTIVPAGPSGCFTGGGGGLGGFGGGGGRPAGGGAAPGG
jgi:hypothetical protein